MLIVLGGLCSTFAILSMVFNDYFCNINILGWVLPFNFSVIFFCLNFFILDIVTELHDQQTADVFLALKIFTQVVFVICGQTAIMVSHIEENELTRIILVSPHMILYGAIATIIGCKLTIKIMHTLKIRYNGRFLFLRYLASTLPGEFAFSLVFSALSFSHGRSMHDFLKVYFTLIFVKFSLSIFFAILMDPITRVAQYYRNKNLTMLTA